MTCPDAKTWSLLSMNLLDENRAEALRQHCLECERCRTAWQEASRQHSELLDGFEESMEYGMPSYIRDGEVQVAFASQKRTINVYFLIHDVMLKNRSLMEGLNTGKGCIRFSSPQKIDYGLIARLMKETVESSDPICL
jgi:uncharacterized protein YdhG (YjbR/CyaY superfamily)